MDSQQIATYPKPAGFWIRVLATLIDGLVFIPVVLISNLNFLQIKSIFLLILTAILNFIYKPFMESFYGATLGKMACKIKVIDPEGNNLTLEAAYARFFPFLLISALGLTGSIIVFSLPEFKNATSLVEVGQIITKSDPTRVLQQLAAFFLMIDCLFVAFSQRKRAIHDMIANSYCVYK